MLALRLFVASAARVLIRRERMVGQQSFSLVAASACGGETRGLRCTKRTRSALEALSRLNYYFQVHSNYFQLLHGILARSAATGE